MRYFAAFVLLVACLLVARRVHGWRRRVRARRLAAALADEVARCFLVEPCPRCHESEMLLLDVSPNARSLEYACLHCDKRMRGAAASPDAAGAAELFRELEALLAHLADAAGPDADAVAGDLEFAVVFDTPEAPLPYERTTRTAIPAAVRSEVWRRDEGRCAECGAQENLEFDHVIPLAKGGATSVRNLQLLCKACNLRKGVGV